MPAPASAPPRLPRRRRLLAAVGAGVLVAGAPHVRAAPSQRLLVAAFPLVDEIVRAALPGWQRLNPGVQVQVASRQYADHHTAMTTALSTARGLPDVMALEASYMGRFANGHGLLDLAGPPFDGLALRPRYVPFAFDTAINTRGALVAVPTDIGPGTLLYRADLLQRAGLEEGALTASWESFIEAGRRLKAATGAYLVAHVQTVKDIVVRAGLKPGEGLYYDRDSRVLVQSPPFVRAFELARQVRQARLDARLAAWSNEWAEGFRRGKLATELTGAWMVGQMANWVAPGTKGLWRAAPLPEGAFVGYGGTYYALPRRADPERRALAWSLVRWLTLDRERQFAAFRSQDAFPALLETLDDPFFDEPLPFLGGQPARRLWRDAARRIQAVPLHKQNNFADEVVGTELDNVLDRGKDIASALGDAARLLQRRALR